MNEIIQPDFNGKPVCRDDGLLHSPVLADKVAEYLIGDKTGIYFDGTIGFGGHSKKLLNCLDNAALLIATDVSNAAFEYSANLFSNDSRVKIYNYNFSKIGLISRIESIDAFDGIFADLGVSSFQLDSADEGFTFRQDSLLDLRMDKNISLTASDLLNTFSEEEIADILFRFGEEKNSRKIARLICRNREIKKIVTTQELVKIVAEITPPNYLNKSLMRVFQALRIYINDELEVLKSFLIESVSLLKIGGRIAILTYHSLEDRIVKDIFKLEAQSCICPPEFPVCVCNKVKKLQIITKKPVLPDEAEVKLNYRARSAKLRVAEKI